MSSQTAGAVPGPFLTWPDRDSTVAVAEICATRFSLARGATDAAPCKASVGVGVGGPRAVRGSCAPATGVVAPRPKPRAREAPEDFPRPPLRGGHICDQGLDATNTMTPAREAEV
jgi:hypothetical protein